MSDDRWEQERDEHVQVVSSEEGPAARDDQKGGNGGSGDSQQGAGQQDSPTVMMPPPTIVEWGVRLASVSLLALLIGIVIWEALQPPRPAEFAFDVQESQLRQDGGEWVLPVQMQNIGTEGVVDLTLTGELVDAQGTVVTEASAVFPLVGGGEQLTFALWFDEDPREYELRFNIDSYTHP